MEMFRREVPLGGDFSLEKRILELREGGNLENATKRVTCFCTESCRIDTLEHSNDEDESSTSLKKIYSVLVSMRHL